MNKNHLFDEPSFEILNSCLGCHFTERNYDHGEIGHKLKKWTNAKCYGCHQEIDGVARHVQANVKDERILYLPVGLKKLHAMKDNPLPYLQAPLNPLLANSTPRMNQTTLINYLRQPSGKCRLDTCQAPRMMAYTDLNLRSFHFLQKKLKQQIPEESKAEIQGDGSRGLNVFQKTCESCHQTSDISGYDSVGLSLFSAQWIEKYVTGTVKHKQPRTMPIFALSKQDALDLYAYFQNKRQKQSELLRETSQAQNLTTQWKKMTSKKLMDVRWNQYLSKQIWKNAGCVHCHAGEARAQKAFNMESNESIMNYLSSEAHQFEVYRRLMIRHQEAHFGLGGESAGMPMTGAPIPKKLIQKLAQWMKSGCVNEHSRLDCKIPAIE